MVWAIARRELLLQLRDGRLLVTAVLLLALLGAATAVGWSRWTRGEAERVRFAEQSYEQWLNQGPKHPHRAAAYGLYVAKPETPLAVFEPGLRPYAGRTLWLEAHSNAAFSNAPADDDLTASPGLGESSGAGLLHLLGGLVALVLGALGVARERETGVLRQLLAQGVKPSNWLAGKYLGLAGALAVPLAPFGAVVLAAALWAAPSGALFDTAARTVVALGAGAVYLLALLAVGMVISVLARSSRTALMAALGLWVIGSVLTPRAASHLALRLAPTPDAAVYAEAISEELVSGYGAQPGWDERLKRLERDTLARYGVARLADLPVGFSGLRMIAMDAWTLQVADRHDRRLQATYGRQEQVRLAAAAAAPFLAVRSVTHGMAGTDWPHYQHFAGEAELYRRAFNARMNLAIVRSLRGEAWEMNAGREVWAEVPPFRYAAPDAAWALRAQAPALAILAAWLAGALLALTFVGRRLRP